ncbi:gamma-glutamyl-gamma-aminobutyrate hydrolase family protein [Nonomuraea ferruginea]
MMTAALEARTPFLGVCRGLQVLNIALGGTLHQHLPDVVGHTGHSPAPRPVRPPSPCAPPPAASSPRSSAAPRSPCPTTTTRPSTAWARA